MEVGKTYMLTGLSGLQDALNKIKCNTRIFEVEKRKMMKNMGERYTLKASDKIFYYFKEHSYISTHGCGIGASKGINIAVLKGKFIECMFDVDDEPVE